MLFEEAAELLLVNGNIYTVDQAFSKASVLAVKNGVIAYAGDDHRAGAALLSSRARQIDLARKTVIPGLIDGHLHFLLQGQRLSEIDIHLRSKEEILEQVAIEAQRLAPGQWILGRGWNHELWKKNEWPRKEELDAVAPANPVALNRADAHSMWVNSLALEAAGIDRHTPNPPGGEILRTQDGDVWGILIDTVIFRVWAVIPPLSDEQALNACLKAQNELFGYGITSVGDAWQTMNDHLRLKNYYARGALAIRVHGMLASVDLHDQACFKEEYRPVHGLFNDRLSLRTFKVVLDGSLGSRSAWMTRDYADRQGHRGNSRYTNEQLRALIEPAINQGFQIAVHAIGDAAVIQAITVLEEILGRTPGSAAGHRIEHFQTAAPNDVARAVRLGIIPAMQTIHEKADKYMAEIRLPPAALAASYPWRDVIDNGGIFANGSDSPMEIVNPFKGFHAAITRTDFSPLTRKPEELRLTREEALKSFTVWAATAEFTEDRKGSLEVGKLADFAVLDRDIMTCPEEDVANTRVLLTVLGGGIVMESNFLQ